jgi:hypothetical protein
MIGTLGHTLRELSTEAYTKNEKAKEIEAKEQEREGACAFSEEVSNGLSDKLRDAAKLGVFELYLPIPPKLLQRQRIGFIQCAAGWGKSQDISAHLSNEGCWVVYTWPPIRSAQ